MINTPSTLRSVRRSHKLTLADLGRAVGLSAAQLSRIERNGCMARDTADRIAQYFRRELTIEQVMFPERRVRKAR